MDTLQHISGFILCGGKSSRMGRDKGHLLFKGKPFSKWAIDAIQPFTDSISLVTNHDSYAVFEHALLYDIFPYTGPMGGIYTALHSSIHDWNLIVSCDCPGITRETIQYLIDETPTHASVSFFKKQQRAYPLIGLYHKRILPVFKESLLKKDLSLMKTLSQIPYHPVDLPQNLHASIQNINTPEELSQLNNENMIQVKYFGAIAYETKCSNEKVKAKTLTELIDTIYAKYPISHIPVKFAVNQEIFHDTSKVRLKEHDEVAVLPPFAGG